MPSSEANSNQPKTYELEVTPDPRILEYDPKYQAGFENLVNDVHAEFGFPPDPVLDQDLVQPELYYQNTWVLIQDDEVVGSVALKAGTRDDEVILKRMYVRPFLRGKGFGKQLLQTALIEAQSSGFKKVLLDTNRKQLNAQKAYEAAGFRLVGEEGNVLFYELSFEGDFRAI